MDELNTPLVADIMVPDVPVMAPSTSLADALSAMGSTDAGVVFCQTGDAIQVLNQAHCTELLVAAVQGFPVPKCLGDVAEPIGARFHRAETLSAVLLRITHTDVELAVMHGDRIIGYVGPAQWSTLTSQLLDLPTRLPNEPMECMDELTGLPDYRAFRAYLELALIEHQDMQAPFAVALIEVDWRQGLADRHSIEDERRTVQRISSSLMHRLRETDTLFALESGKWALLMTEINTAIGRGVALRLLDGIWKDALPNHGSPLGRITLSIGLAGPDMDADTCDCNAEEALEQSVMSGGHQVRVFGERLI
ncbi:diguanylate cyclase [Litorivicinus lipolyticus]|uniref:Diguanylate cyclase n=1 Tax=Litorivicinus lipolyticus TaxID=418701 RepID=A0A5Q2Q9C5_9GAMM|nr:GGDEF domain-containing protein [Litorivicinus lipolyticus]QGG79763.1 diguanylate cyclase [Litorivicinus lipolyticus]